MANHVVSINPMSTESIDKAILEVERIKQNFLKQCDTFLQRIAEEAAAVASSAYGSAVTVSVNRIDGGYAIVASGKAVMFLEFGSGLLTDNSDMFVKEVEFPVYPGSWSELRGTGEFYATGKWHYKGKEYQYIVPRNAMQKAYESVAKKCESIAKEVFG